MISINHTIGFHALLSDLGLWSKATPELDFMIVD